MVLMNAPDPSPRDRRTAYLILAVSTFLLALVHVIGRAVHEEVPPLGLSFWRWLVGAVVLVPFVIPHWRVTFSTYRQHWRDFLVLGGLIVGATSLILMALNYTTATNVALINATQPAITTLMSRAFYGVRLEGRHLAGILISFAGVLAMISRGSVEPLVTLDFNNGDLLAIVAMLGFAGYAVRLVRTPHGLNATRALFAIIAGGCLLLLPFYIAESVLVRVVPVNTVSIGAIITIALLVSVGAMLMWNWGNATVGANRASIFMNLVPVFGAFMGVTLLGESFEAYHLAGMILICLGVWLVVGRRRRRSQSTQA
jgi:drug/metabolite transporter (DMT)-like permease